MGHFRTTPNYDQPITIGDHISTTWWRWMQDTDSGAPPSGEINVSPVASPFVYSPKTKGNLIINGGTVTAIAIARSGAFYTVGLTAGTFNLCQNDQIQVTYSAAPTMTFFPT